MEFALEASVDPLKAVQAVLPPSSGGDLHASNKKATAAAAAAGAAAIAPPSSLAISDDDNDDDDDDDDDEGSLSGRVVAAAAAGTGREHNMVGALAVADEPTAPAFVRQEPTGGSSSTSRDSTELGCLNGSSGGDDNGGNSSEEVDAYKTGKSPASGGSTEARGWHARYPSGVTTPSGGIGDGRGGSLADDGSGKGDGTSASTPQNRGSPLVNEGSTPSVASGDESDVGSVDEDGEFYTDYTWFSSEKRASGGVRKHGRGRVRGERTYDRVRINDNAEAMNKLRQELADGIVEETEGRSKLRALEDEIFTVELGDTIEIRSGNEHQPYVGKIVRLDRERRRYDVRWFFVRHEVKDNQMKDMEPREILLSDRFSPQTLDSIERKVETVSEMPPCGEDLPPNTYLCYRGYDTKRKAIVPLLADGSLDRKYRGKSSTKENQTVARAMRTSSTPSDSSFRRAGSSSRAGVRTPPRRLSSSASSSIMSPSQEDNDNSNIMLQRWNRIGPEFDVSVPAWTGPPTGTLTPPPEERQAVHEQLAGQQVWSSSAAVQLSDDFLARAKKVAPILPGTIVYIKPMADGRWGDGSDSRRAGSNGAGGLHSGGGAAASAAPAGPTLASTGQSFLKWGLVSKPPPSSSSRSALNEAHARSNGGDVAPGAPFVDKTRRTPAGGGGAAAAAFGMPSAPQPQWFTQQQQQYQQLAGGVHKEGPLARMQRHDFLQQVMLNHQHVAYMQQQRRRQQQQQHQHQPAYSLLNSGWLSRHGGPGFGMAPSPPSAFTAHGPAPRAVAPDENGSECKVPAPVPQGVAETPGEAAMRPGSVVWIANPCEGKLPLPVERDRVVLRDFQEEASNVLWEAGGDIPEALEKISSQHYQGSLKGRLEEAGEIWTFQQVKAVAKKCKEFWEFELERRRKAPNERRRKALKFMEHLLGDDLTHEEYYGVASKRFQDVADFSRRFHPLPRFGESANRREVADAAICAAAARAEAAAAKALSRASTRHRPKPGMYTDVTHDGGDVGSGSGDVRPAKKPKSSTYTRGRTQGHRPPRPQSSSSSSSEEVVEEETSSDESVDADYNPEDSEGSSVLFVRKTRRRRRSSQRRRGQHRLPADEAAVSGRSCSVDRKSSEEGNRAAAKKPKAKKAATPAHTPTTQLPEVLDLCSSDEADVGNTRDPSVGANDHAAAAGSEDGGRFRHLYHRPDLALATAAEVAAAAAVPETQDIAAEAAASAMAMDGGGGPEPRLPTVFLMKDTRFGGEARQETGGDMITPTRHDSPVPGVTSDNTGGVEAATAGPPKLPDDHTGSKHKGEIEADNESELTCYLDSVHATLGEVQSKRFLAFLCEYREGRLSIDQLVDAVSGCFDRRVEEEMKLVDKFNTFLPPGHAVRYPNPNA